MSDLTALPDKMMEEEPEFKTLVSQFENGYEQRRAVWATPLRRFKLFFENRTQTEMETMRDFFLGKLGRWTAFTWTNPNDSVEYTVRFDEDAFMFKRVDYELFDYEITLQEVRT